MRTGTLWDELEGDDWLGYPVLSGAGGGSPAGGVPFLPDVLGDPGARIIVSAAFGADLKGNPALWNFVDITADVRQADGNRVNITPMGRSDEFSQAQPAGCGFQLDNTTGDYTANHPGSKWWPYVRRNTPVKVELYIYGLLKLEYQGYANGWVPSWDTSGNVAVVTVSCSGILRRLNQGKSPLKSAMYRACVASNPVAYWSLEDAKNATQAASGLAGGIPLQVLGTPKFAATDGPVGSDKVVAYSTETTGAGVGGELIAQINTGAVHSFRVEYSFRLDVQHQHRRADLSDQHEEERDRIRRILGTVRQPRCAVFPVDRGRRERLSVHQQRHQRRRRRMASHQAGRHRGRCRHISQGLS